MFNTHEDVGINVAEITNTTTLKINNKSIASAKVTFLVSNSADLSVSVIKPMHISYVGQNIVYFIRVKNNGPSKATDVILTDILPPNCICSYINSSKGTYELFKNRIAFFLEDLNCNSNTIIVISVIPKHPCILTNHCFITANEHDKNLNNNICSTRTQIYSYDPDAPIYCIFDPLRCF